MTVAVALIYAGGTRKAALMYGEQLLITILREAYEKLGFALDEGVAIGAVDRYRAPFVYGDDLGGNGDDIAVHERQARQRTKQIVLGRSKRAHPYGSELHTYTGIRRPIAAMTFRRRCS